jgi:hypothetical protein
MTIGANEVLETSENAFRKLCTPVEYTFPLPLLFLRITFEDEVVRSVEDSATVPLRDEASAVWCTGS